MASFIQNTSSTNTLLITTLTGCDVWIENEYKTIEFGQIFL